MKTLLFAAALLGTTLAASAQTREQTIGCWKMPSRAGETLQLNRDGSFSFNDYNAKTQAFENMYGTWTMTGATLTLLYDDRPKQRFMYSKDKRGTWMLTKAGGFMFVKGTPAECKAD